MLQNQQKICMCHEACKCFSETHFIFIPELNPCHKALKDYFKNLSTKCFPFRAKVITVTKAVRAKHRVLLAGFLAEDEAAASEEHLGNTNSLLKAQAVRLALSLQRE